MRDEKLGNFLSVLNHHNCLWQGFPICTGFPNFQAFENEKLLSMKRVANWKLSNVFH